MSFGKWQPYCLGLNVLRTGVFTQVPLYPPISLSPWPFFLWCLGALSAMARLYFRRHYGPPTPGRLGRCLSPDNLRYRSSMLYLLLSGTNQCFLTSLIALSMLWRYAWEFNEIALWKYNIFPDFNGHYCAVIEVWECISYFMSHFTRHVITYPCWD